MWEPSAYYQGRRGPVLNHSTVVRIAELFRAARAIKPSASVPANYIFTMQEVIKDRSNFNKLLSNTPGFVKTYQAGTVGWYFDERLTFLARQQGQEVYPLNTNTVPTDIPAEVVFTLTPVDISTPEDTVTVGPWFTHCAPVPDDVDALAFKSELAGRIVALGGIIQSNNNEITADILSNLSEVGEQIGQMLASIGGPEDV